MNCPYGTIVFITGASSGIGHHAAQHLAREGLTVYGTSRKAPQPSVQIGNGTLCMLQADVTCDQSVQTAIEHVIQIEGRIDVMILCAGIGICGAVEDCSADDAYEQMNTNYLGIVRVLHYALPHMRAQRNGLVLLIGSVGGLFSIPFQTMYSSSKYALEALVEGLRIELKPWNVKAALVEPGDTKTGFTNARRYAKGCASSDYVMNMNRAVGRMIRDEMNGMDVESVTNVICKLMQKKNPPIRKIVGGSYKLLVFLKRMLPAALVERFLSHMYTNPKLPCTDVQHLEQAGQ